MENAGQLMNIPVSFHISSDSCSYLVSMSDSKALVSEYSFDRLLISYGTFVLIGSSNIDDDAILGVCKFDVLYDLGA
jgi:hypothetical protein